MKQFEIDTVDIADKIVVLSGPNSTYDVEPGKLLDIIVEAKTDKLWQNQMKFYWLWYQEIEDPKTGIRNTGTSICTYRPFLPLFLIILSL